MTEFKTLSVAEDDYNSDRLSAEQNNTRYVRINRRTETLSTKLRISVDTSRRLIVTLKEEGSVKKAICFENVDIDGLIQHLQEVKVFLSEEDMIARLLGKK